MTHDPDEMGAVYARLFPNVVDLSARRREAARERFNETLAEVTARVVSRIMSDDYPEDAA